MPRRTRAVAAVALAGLALAASGCGRDAVEGPPPAAPTTIRLTSPVFEEGHAVPARYTCKADDVSPPLRWRGVPDRARALALVLEDPDAPGGTFVHWTLLDVPPHISALRTGEVPAGASEGGNSFGGHGYRGPCPPEGDPPHRYVWLLYALDAPLGLGDHPSPAAVREAIGRRAIARGQLTGRFGR